MSIKNIAILGILLSVGIFQTYSNSPSYESPTEFIMLYLKNSGTSESIANKWKERLKESRFEKTKILLADPDTDAFDAWLFYQNEHVPSFNYYKLEQNREIERTTIHGQFTVTLEGDTVTIKSKIETGILAPFFQETYGYLVKKIEPKKTLDKHSKCKIEGLMEIGRKENIAHTQIIATCTTKMSTNEFYRKLNEKN